MKEMSFSRKWDSAREYGAALPSTSRKRPGLQGGPLPLPQAVRFDGLAAGAGKPAFIPLHGNLAEFFRAEDLHEAPLPDTGERPGKAALHVSVRVDIQVGPGEVAPKGDLPAGKVIDHMARVGHGVAPLFQFPDMAKVQ